MREIDATRFFTEEEKQKIEEATREAESETIGEIVAMVVESSDDYGEADIIGSVLLAGLLGFIPSVLLFHASVWAFVLIAIPAYFLFRRVFAEAPQKKMMLVGKRTKDEAVKRKAFAEFHENGLDRTKENTGILFLISLLEREVWVLADKGIYEKIGQATLNEFAAVVSKGIHEGGACAALCESIRKAGELLSRHFPRTPGDMNELPNAVIVER